MANNSKSNAAAKAASKKSDAEAKAAEPVLTADVHSVDAEADAPKRPKKTDVIAAMTLKRAGLDKPEIHGVLAAEEAYVAHRGTVKALENDNPRPRVVRGSLEIQPEAGVTKNRVQLECPSCGTLHPRWTSDLFQSALCSDCKKKEKKGKGGIKALNLAATAKRFGVSEEELRKTLAGTAK